MPDIYFWRIDAVTIRKAPVVGHVSMLASEEAETEAQARSQFAAKSSSNGYRIRKVTKGQLKFETYDQLVAWLKAECVGPQEARGAVQTMVINSRPANQKPWPCETCGTDINRTGYDHIDNSYYCKKCKAWFQSG